MLKLYGRQVLNKLSTTPNIINYSKAMLLEYTIKEERW